MLFTLLGRVWAWSYGSRRLLLLLRALREKEIEQWCAMWQVLEGAMQKPWFQDLQTIAEELPVGSEEDGRRLGQAV